MKNSNSILLKSSTLGGILCVTIPFWMLMKWISSFNLGSNQAERVEIFYSHFPEFLQGRYELLIISLGFCVSAILLNSIGLKLSSMFWKALNIISIIVSILLLFLNLFMMM